ncbi:sugar ABC transporter ATP-binding protein [Mesorhizobium sp. B2-5-3]|uniref:sugar ABC transporter ATP-binding protein n=1 Tax=Mesorhizobium sp. B2-5-3 TaxID=2589927 RepID=UPI001127995B|nr:sugar ABC transporter ATP-binding protein [Mesorhizobium sp. B2-5-3]TPK33903.1 sugar ABC transporter ATP-binding protein [Mesorhizobium sp. B2-5-3]
MNSAVHQRAIEPPADRKGMPLLLSADGLRRTFGETIALDSCSLSIREGEIHAVVGENGSGKSTLIKILSGIVRAEAGTLDWLGRQASFANPRAAQDAGIATVFQETLVLPDMSIRDNVMLGLDGMIRRKMTPLREREAVRKALAAVGIGNLDIERLAGTVSLANRQMIGVARSLMRPWRLLILDESTSAIDIEDRDRLFEVLRSFRGEGRSILFVSHRMDEIHALADCTTVLRSGRSVASLERGAVSSEILLDLMSTREGARAAEGEGCGETIPANAEVIVGVRGLSVLEGKPTLDLDLRRGEIIGVGGLEGHGQVALLECIAGLRRAPTGTVHVGTITIRSQRDASRAKIAFLPRDRKSEGIFAPLSVLDNVTVSALGSFARWGVLGTRKRIEVAGEVTRRTRVKMAGLDTPISALSGGNQQKALLGRLIATQPRVLVLNDPMRGVDLGAKRDLYEVLNNLALSGVSILMLSTELVELCLLCHRVVVFHDHAVSAIVERGDLSERALIDAMFSQRRLETST